MLSSSQWFTIVLAVLLAEASHAQVVPLEPGDVIGRSVSLLRLETASPHGAWSSGIPRGGGLAG